MKADCKSDAISVGLHGRFAVNHSNGVLLASNDDWRDTQEADITATGLAPTNDAESAILATLAPSLYTAIVRGGNETTGVALVEVYNLGPGTVATSQTARE